LDQPGRNESDREPQDPTPNRIRRDDPEWDRNGQGEHDVTDHVLKAGQANPLIMIDEVTNARDSRCIWLLAFTTALLLTEEEHHGEHGHSDGEEECWHASDGIR
jgi:hypothetical protein